MFKQVSQRGHVLLGCYCLGVMFWLAFMYYGHPSYTFYDWRYIHQWVDVIKQALVQGKIPFHASLYLGEFETGKFEWGTRFLAIPFVIASPQIILLKVLSVPAFLTVQIVMMYTIGFWGMCQWIKKLQLSIPATVFVWMIVTFNGAIVARMGVGHIQNTGYLVIPTFLWLMYQFIQQSPRGYWIAHAKHALGLALFLFFCLLQGSLHTVHQMIIVGFLIVLFSPRWMLWYLGAIVTTVILASYMIWPNALYGPYDMAARYIMGGYGCQSGEVGIPLIKTQLSILKPLNVFPHLWEAMTAPFTAAVDAAWEYSLYISVFGLGLLGGGVVMAIRQRGFEQVRRHQLFMPMLIVIVMASSSVLYYAFALATKFVSLPCIDRLPSRLMIYPFYAVLLLAAVGFDRLFVSIATPLRRYMQYGVLMSLLVVLVIHAYGWSVAQTESHHIPTSLDATYVYKTMIYDTPGDAAYRTTVIASYVTTCIAAFIVISLYVLASSRLRQLKQRHHV